MRIIRLQGPAEKRAGIYYEYDADSKPLGEGGMGRVFKGYRVNERTGERMPVAIKAIYENIPENVVERARREAEIQVDHDNLIRMYGFVENRIEGSDKVHYHVVMELLVGVTLEDVLNGTVQDRQGLHIPFASEIRNQYLENRTVTVVRIMKALLAGLMSLHDRGIIHRDIDPSNIMLTIDRKIKLIDFGICKQIVNLGSQDKGLTSAGVFMGKVNYAAPELVLGDVRSQNYTTDIYAAGVILYQLVTGHLPFSGNDQDVLTANLRKPLPMGDVKRKDLKNIIKRATEKTQGKRYQSAAEMRVDLEHVDTNGKEGLPWGKIGIAAGILVVVGVGAGMMMFSGDSQKETQPVLAQAETAAAPVRVPSSDEMLDNARAYMKMDAADSLEKGKAILMSLASDSAYMPAMLEQGMNYARPTAAFPELTERQQRMHITPDLNQSNKWLEKVLEEDPTNYKAAYWIYNNLMTKVENESITPAEQTRLASAFRLFKQLVTKSTDTDASRYRQAMEKADDENTLRAWAIIY